MGMINMKKELKNIKLIKSYSTFFKKLKKLKNIYTSTLFFIFKIKKQFIFCF